MSNLAHRLIPAEAARHVRVASALPRSSMDRNWGIAYLAGKLVELHSDAAAAGLTAGLGLVRNAQEAGETVVWLTFPESLFFPCDAIASGIDLDALVVVRLPDAVALLRAADKLVRSGAFGLVMVDVASLSQVFSVSLSQQSRLSHLVRKHQVAMVFLTGGGRPFSVAGSLISFRGHVARRPWSAGLYEVKISVLKDKQRGPGWHHAELCYGPDGLC